MKQKIKLKVIGTEQQIMESLLNMTSSGIDVSFSFALTALAKCWHFDKLVHYYNLIEEAREDSDKP